MLSCSHKVVKVPQGNMESINTINDDMAPMQKPLHITSGCDICNKNAQSNNQIADDVQTSKSLIEKLMGEELSKTALEYLRKNIESITFTSDISGFVALSHSPDQNFAKEIGLPIEGIVGGTDIFEFTKENGKFVFRNLGEPINSEFWDSHPTAIKDKNCNILLVWSSDRYDIPANESYPYTNRGNTDLFYSFNVNGKWGKVQSFSSVGDSINFPKSNELSPYITCQCKSPLLIFASNRGGKDYNLYKVHVSINFEKQSISSDNIVEKLNDSINSSADEFFPYVPNPISNNSYIYFSSNRFEKPEKVNKDTIYKNIGLYDLYKFPFVTDCSEKPKSIPSGKIKYNIVIKSVNSGNNSIEPLFITTEINGQKREMKNGETIDLPNNFKINTYGGSLHNEGTYSRDGTLDYYQNRVITQLPPEIKNRQIIQKYDTIVNQRFKMVLDTLEVTSDLVESTITELKSKNHAVKSVTFIDPSFRIIWLKKVLDRGNFISKKRLITQYDTIQKYDTVYKRITRENPALSVLAQKDFSVNYLSAKDMYIYDTIYIYPHYYHCPPCRWEYAQNPKAINKTVPFFQTGMWELNTSENLNRQLKEFSSGKYSGASFIELQPDNQEFGYLDPNFSQAQTANRRYKRDQRIQEYRVFADSVDKFMNRMANDISNKIIPAFTDELKKAPENLLIIHIKAYSDIRPIVRGWYTGDKKIRYYSPSFDESTMKLTTSKASKVEIFPMASMVGEANDTLSKLRAYSGYYELKKMLMKSDAFMDYVYKGEVYFPDEINIEEEIKYNINNAKIIFVIEGKQVDPALIPEINEYKNRINDFYTLDGIRRVDVIINRVTYKNGKLESACCEE
jgi:hypothetical protein